MATPRSTIRLRLLAAVALCISAGCSTTTHTVVEEPVVDEDSAEPPAERARVDSPGGDVKPPAPAAASRSSKEDADAIATCQAKPSRDDCHVCCQVASSDMMTCAKEAACEAKAPADDCRSSGCASGETCSMCWTGFACLPPGIKC